MYPILFHIGPLTVYSFGLMLALSVLTCSFLLSRDAVRFGISREEIFDFVFWTLVSGILGARVFFILLNIPVFIENPKEIFMLQNGGLAWQGGLVLGGAAAFYFVRKKKLPVRLMMDLAAPYLALGQSIGRIGCFLNGCCYGRPVIWGPYYPVHGAHLYPTQIYDTILLFLIFLALKKFQKFSMGEGKILALYLILASAERFFNEFFRGDHDWLFWGMSIFQIVSVVVLIAGIVLYWALSRASRK